MSVGLFLGAGFSKWAADLPLAGELFDFNISVFGTKEARKLRQVETLKKQWEATWSSLEPNASFVAESFIAYAREHSEEYKELINWYVTRRLVEPFIWMDDPHGKRHTLMIDEYRRFEIAGVKRAIAFLSLFASVDTIGIITTNYDLLVEYALGTKGFNYGIPMERLHGRGPYPISQWQNPVHVKGSIPLAKIHGSISWDDNGRYTDARRGITGHALIVAPMQPKERLDPLERDWELAGRILAQTTHLVVFGFAFNRYDKEVLTLLERNGHGLKSVLLVNRSSHVDSALAVWPYLTTAQIKFCPPPVDSINECIENWRRHNSASGDQ
jgi:hypothetical protein